MVNITVSVLDEATTIKLVQVGALAANLSTKVSFGIQMLESQAPYVTSDEKLSSG